MRKYLFLSLLSLLLCTQINAQSHALLAFPTAEGYGKYATGGRGGEVVEVTNLLDDPSNPPQGSLRWALKQHKGKPITIVFRVSGVIDLNGNELRNNRSDITIAGQTAPGDGICIKGGCVNLGGSRNLIIRHIRSRVGVLNDNTYCPGEVDSENFIAGASLNIENGGNFIIDHCTFGWSAEENGGWYDNDNTTVQWCIFHEGLYNAGHGKGSRSYGAVLGGKTATYHHNLFAHNYNRSPRFGATTKNDKVMLLDFVNNVNYNYGKKNACYGGDNRQGDLGLFQLNFVNNYYKPGPAYTGDRAAVFIGASYCNPDQGSQGKSYGKWHLSGNYMEGSYAASKNYNSNNYNGFDISAYTEAVPGLKMEQMKSDHIPVDCPVNTESAHDAYNSVLAGAGAFPRDAVDSRIIEEVRTGTASTWASFNNHRVCGIIDKPSDAGGYPTYKTYNEVTDNDHDGMDDAWETKYGFDPANAADRNLVLKSGYTALEAYLCSLVGENIPVEFAKPYDIVVAQDGSGDYKTIQGALDAVPENGQRYTIFVKNGIYEEKLFIGNRWAGSKKVVSLIGEDVDGVVITWDDYSGKMIDYPGKDDQIKADGSTCGTFTINAPDFYMENITVKNPSTQAQAIALCQKGDRHVLKNCKILGNQDTHRTKKGKRYFYYGCTIEGGVDFIYAGGTCYFYQCNIVSNRGGFVTAPEDVPNFEKMSNGKNLYYGFFFNDCDLTATSGVSAGSCYLGRPWGEKSGSVFMNCRLGAHINAAGWSKMGDETWKDCSFLEYKSRTADGSALADVSKRVSWSGQVSEDDRYYLMGLKYIYNKVNSSSLFNPLPTVVAPKAPEKLSVSNKKLSWTAVPEAEYYAIYADGKFLDFASANSYLDIKTTGTPSYQVRSIGANGNMSGFNGSAATPTAQELDSILSPDYRVKLTTSISDAQAGSISISPNTPSYDKDAMVTLSATHHYGYRFVHWEDETGQVLSTENPYQHKMEREITIKAVYRTLPIYTLNIESSAEGSYAKYLPKEIISVSEAPQTVGEATGYEEGHELIVTVKDHPIFRFASWENAGDSLTRIVKMDGNKNLKASFTQGDFLAAWNFEQSQFDYYQADMNPFDVFAEMNLLDAKGNYITWNKVRPGYYGAVAVSNAGLAGSYFDMDAYIPYQGPIAVWSKVKSNGDETCVLEYSLDGGNTYQSIASQKLDAQGTWQTLTAALPQNVLTEESFRIRWILSSTTSTNPLILSDVVLLKETFTSLPDVPSTDGYYVSGSTLYIRTAEPIAQLNCYDLSGRAYMLDASQSANLWTGDLQSLSTGVYLIRYQTENKQVRTIKLIR